MNGLENIPIVTPLIEVPPIDGSGLTPWSISDGSVVYGYKGPDGMIYDEFGRLLGKPTM